MIAIERGCGERSDSPSCKIGLGGEGPASLAGDEQAALRAGTTGLLTPTAGHLRPSYLRLGAQWYTPLPSTSIYSYMPPAPLTIGAPYAIIDCPPISGIDPVLIHPRRRSGVANKSTCIICTSSTRAFAQPSQFAIDINTTRCAGVVHNHVPLHIGAI